jgi:hypothetical protein
MATAAPGGTVHGAVIQSEKRREALAAVATRKAKNRERYKRAYARGEKK